MQTEMWGRSRLTNTFAPSGEEIFELDIDTLAREESLYRCQVAEVIRNNLVDIHKDAIARFEFSYEGRQVGESSKPSSKKFSEVEKSCPDLISLRIVVSSSITMSGRRLRLSAFLLQGDLRWDSYPGHNPKHHPNSTTSM